MKDEGGRMNEDFIPLFSVLSGRLAPLPEYREKELGGLRLLPLSVFICVYLWFVFSVSPCLHGESSIASD
jgi:hypothetical protein